MRSLFVMDPLEKLHVEGDSTYVTMRECCDRGFEVWMCTPSELFALNGSVHAVARKVNVTAAAPYFDPRPPQDLALDAMDVVWMRKDPPFDMSYIFATYLLDMTSESTLVVNGSYGLKLFNEKIWVQQSFSQFHPPTLLSSDQKRLRAFVEDRPGKTVLKPWDGNGGRGVVVTRSGDRNLNSVLDLLTQDGNESVIAQAFVEGVEKGDKRILIFDGEPVGCLLRVPTAGDHRANIHVGATVTSASLSERDKEVCDAIRPYLKQWDQVFVGIDMIDGWLTEINVTSPTGIREINRLDGTRLEATLVDCVLAKLNTGRV